MVKETLKKLTEDKEIIILAALFAVLVYFFILAPPSVPPDNIEYNTSEVKVLESREHPNMVSTEISDEEAGNLTSIIYYGDFRCPHCQSFEHEEMNTLIDNYIESGDVIFYYKPVRAIDNFSYVQGGAAYSVWNNDPRNYWESHKKLISIGGDVDDSSSLIERMNSTSLSTEVKQSIKSKEYKSQVKINTRSGVQNGMTGTPYYIVDNKTFSNYENVKKYLDENI